MPKSRKNKRAKPAKPSAQRQQNPINWFKHRYGTDFLAGFGPLVAASVSVASVVETALLAQGQLPPAPVLGVLLVDTGATVTSISVRAATALGLVPTRTSKSYGSGGLVDNPVFFARLTLVITDGTRRTELMFEQELLGIQDLEKPAAAAGITIDGNHVEMIGLLGRDVLKITRMEYDGVAGDVKIRFDLSKLPQAP